MIKLKAKNLNGKTAMISKRVISVLLSAALALAAVSCTGKVERSSAPDSGTADTAAVSDISHKDTKEIRSMDNVKLLGRAYSHQGKVWLGLSATGVEFDFKGTELTVTMSGNCTDDPDRPRVGIYVDSQRVKDILLTEQSTDIKIDGKGETAVNIRIVKLSEALSSCCCIEKIDPGSGSISPSEAKSRKIEFIGDSITCGYGVDDSDASHGFSTATEDCTKAYAYKTAQLLNADCSLVSFSGFGVVSGYTEYGTKASDKTLPQYYDSYGFTYSSGFGTQNPSEIQWNNSFKPDAVVINLGTNDSSYTGDDPVKQKEFSDSYSQFLEKVRKANPDAKIFCTLGIMGTTLNNAMKQGAADYTSRTGDTNICVIEFEAQDVQQDGVGANWHPSEKTHDKAAAFAAEKIKGEMGWY